jgi:hypothetical protein
MLCLMQQAGVWSFGHALMTKKYDDQLVTLGLAKENPI